LNRFAASTLLDAYIAPDLDVLKVVSEWFQQSYIQAADVDELFLLHLQPLHSFAENASG
jgi:hypothetical protein